MGLAPKDFVPLDRRFEGAASADTVAYWSEILADGDNPRDWSWLRGRSRVIALLAQAGSGKTVEFMHQVDQERAADRNAFFFRVERLCSGPLEDAHETPDCRARFERWAKGSQKAEIFLDAVDEAKLPQARTARPLRDALRALSFVLGPHFKRVSIFVSCRSSEWFDDIEQKALDELAEAVSSPGAGAEPVSVFNATFAPLDLARIRRIAEQRGAADAVEMLIDSEAITDIVTPLDAILYLDTYLEFKGTPDLAARFASRGKLLETSVRRRLAEKGGDVRRSLVELGSGLKAARFLAFSSIVAQTMDLAVGGPRKDCIDPQELLASGHAALSPDGIRQLLACSLFMPAGQARVRFYRREARDMLAAQWLRGRIDEGASALAITDRFIKTPFDTPRVPTIYGSMLAWLASYDPLTRRRMIEAAPEWVIEDGDPRSLALEDRIAALEQHVRLGPHRFHGEFRFDVGELRRFARPELEAAIVRHLAAPPAGDLFDHILHFVEAGGYPSATPYLVTLLNDFSRGPGDRMFAIRALIACGKPDDLRAVAQHFLATGGPNISADELFGTSRNDHFLLDLITASYPKVIDARQALALCAQLHGKEYSHDAKSIAQWLAATAPVADLEQWFVGLDRLCFVSSGATYKPFGHDMPPLHRRATILLRALLEVAVRFIREVPQLEVDRDLLIYDRIRHANNLGGSFSMSPRGSPVPAALASSARLRHALYEKLATIEKRKHTAFAYSDHLNWSVYRGEPLREDLRYFLEHYRRCTGETSRDYARTAAFLAQQSSRGKRIRTRLAVALAAVSRRRPDWLIVQEVLVDPVLAPWRRYRARRRWRRRDPDAGLRAFATRRIEALRLRLRIWREWNALRQGTAVALLGHLVLAGGYDAPTEEALIKRAGKRLGGVLIEGARAFARRYRPVDRGRYIYGDDILAQAGYRYNWNADRRMTGIDPAAALYAALLFTTDWPEWASEVALGHPDTWADLLPPLLAREVAVSDGLEHGRYSRFLSTAAHLEEEVRKPLAAPLFTAIAAMRVIDSPEIDRIVRILRADPQVEARLPAFAARHAREAWHEGSVRRALTWLPFWAEKDEAGLRTLLAWMEADPEIVADGLGIYVRLFGEQASGPLPPLGIRMRFADLAYSRIGPQNDPPAREGPQEITARQNLQHLRSSVGELMGSTFDAAERDALEQLLRTYIVPVSPEWAERWRNRYEQQAVKPRLWSHATILVAAEDLAGTPNSGDELYARVSEIIAELENDLARSEFDRRGLFPSTILESDFRAWLGHALDSRRRPWFSIVQEAETAGATRTDLRIELRATGNAVVVIEIKLLHGWTYGELLDKFQSQLIEQYLLTSRVRHGIYLLVDLDTKPRGSMPDGSTPRSAELAAMLNEAATGIAARGGPFAKAQVFRIAPSKRNRRRDAKRAEALLPKGKRSKSPRQGEE